MTSQTAPISYEYDALPRHQLSLDNTQFDQHQAVMEELWENEHVQRAFDVLDPEADKAIRAHSLRVCSLVTAAAISLCMDRRDVMVGATGALLHDIGKSHGDINATVKSTEPITSPAVYDAICQHPAKGAEIARAFGLGRNIVRIIGKHHALQTVRRSYGIAEPLTGVDEGDGFIPDLPQLIGLTAAADIYDALTLDTPERRYQRAHDTGSSRALWLIQTLDTTSRVRGIMGKIVTIDQVDLLR